MGVDNDSWTRVLKEMYYENRMVIVLSMFTGLSVSAVLELRPEQLAADGLLIDGRKVWIPFSIRRSLSRSSGRYYIFEHRLDFRRHRTRQAVYKDIIRACRDLGISDHLTPRAAAKRFVPLFF